MLCQSLAATLVKCLLQQDEEAKKDMKRKVG